MSKKAIHLLFHGDSDGISSAAQAIRALKDKGEIKLRITKPSRLLGDLRNISGSAIVVIMDVGLDSATYTQIFDEVKRIVGEDGVVYYIDHHKLPPGVSVEDVPATEVMHIPGYSASELTNRFFGLSDDRVSLRLAYYGAYADYLEKTPLMQRIEEMWDRRNLVLEASLLSSALEVASIEDKLLITRHLARGARPSEMQDVLYLALLGLHRENEIYRYVEKNSVLEGGLAIVLNPPHQSFLGRAANYAMYIHNAVVGVALRINSQGFVDVSLRTRAGGPDLSVVASEVAAQLGGSGGGHPVAAGMRIPAEKLEDLLQILRERLGGT